MIGAEALLKTLRAMGVERIFASPGSDWAPLWEALARPYEPHEVPEYVSSRHEETAVCMASGYMQSTGKLPAVVLHTTVGALHATMALRQALCAAAHPVILTEGLGRSLRAVDRLVELAEALGAPVLDGWHADYVNFPRGHPLYAGPATEPLPPLLAEADFVLLVEAVAGWHP